MRPVHGMWQRIQETPLQLAIAILAVLAAPLTLATQHLSPWGVIVTVTVGVGGLVTAIGRFAGSLQAESAGVILLIGSFVFLTAQQMPSAHTAVEVAGVLLNYGALMAGFVIRLYVVRRALRIRAQMGRRR